MDSKKIAIIGTGLIGGSLALQLREKGMATRLIGVDANPDNERVAMERGLVDEICPLKDVTDHAEVIILAIPVDQIVNILPGLLDKVTDQVVIDLAGIPALENKPGLAYQGFCW
jgi:prephenate dehydrogenase